MLRLASLLSAASLCIAERFSGSLDVPAHGTVFLSKFCFDYTVPKATGGKHAGLIDVQIDFNMAMFPSDSYLMLLDDEMKSYPDDQAGWMKLSCEEKKVSARTVFDFAEQGGAGHSFRVDAHWIDEHVRPRWWYLAVADCSGKTWKIDFEVHTKNVARGWRQEFSMERQWVLQTSGFFLVGHVGLLLQHSASSDARWRAHPMTQLLTYAVGCSVISLVAFLLNYAYFARHGGHIFALYFFAKLADSLAKMFVMCLLMLLAKGRGVSYTLCKEDLTWLAWRVVPLVLGCFCLESFGEFAESRKYTTGYIYDTHFGTFLLVVDVLILFVFAARWEETHRLEVDSVKKMFYKAFGLMACGWFCSPPVIAVVGLVMAPWVRYEIFFLAQRGVHFVAVLSLVMFFEQSKTSYVDLEGQDSTTFVKAEVLGTGVLKLATGPLPDNSEELKASEMQLFGTES